ncbi:hypothetical protein PR202_gb09101 [Eleusine coracana subsp. coracana]|uniref:Disease resistance R13L4/SHOC-2-like LRR domain-containing protein n=1 Tax=Eleusine coracana subsp. coracana TaxID=191504 RepID=A0AAV5EEQ8_ELECO|nr:hypothetical protein PR202_gb09101 [Eleusine coracana subsp. coracana]
MALSLSQAGSHLASTLDVDQHGHYQDPCTEQAMVLPQMSVTWLLQRAAQMGNTSSSSSLMSSNQAITERVVGVSCRLNEPDELEELLKEELMGKKILLVLDNLCKNYVEFHVMDGKALDECFRNFKCLKTLDLSHTDIRELPESVGYISSLCFLGLNNTNIRRLPDSVCNLFNLQTLELQNSAFLVELPNGIRNLNCLYHLDASKECGPIYIPPGIGQLTNLRTLTTFTVGGVSWNCKASELAHLNSLEGFLHIRSLNNVENAEDAKGACLAAKKLKKLSLEWCHGGEDIESDKQISIAEHVLDALKPHCCEFWAIGTINDKSFPKLEMLRLRDMYNLEWWFISDISIMSCNKLSLSGLQSLKSLRIGNMRQRTCFALPFELHSLQMLEVMCCEHLSSVEGLSELQSLKNLKFRTCPRLNFIQDEPLPDTLETVEIHNNCYSLSKWRPHGFEELHDASEPFSVRLRDRGAFKLQNVDVSFGMLYAVNDTWRQGVPVIFGAPVTARFVLAEVAIPEGSQWPRGTRVDTYFIDEGQEPVRA